MTTDVIYQVNWPVAAQESICTSPVDQDDLDGYLALMTTQYQGVSCLLYSQFHVCDLFTTLSKWFTSRLNMEVTSLTNSRYT